ncbi:GDSL-type esterase/lipase family protein [Gordonia soli]|nr:GDSL-type esterase/lipase family protein [Gordonia soli]
MTITPHLSGATTRVRLSNRFGQTPVTFGRVTVAALEPTGGLHPPTPAPFEGRAETTVAPGHEVLSDPIAFPVTSMRPLVVTVYVAGTATGPTKHWNANATTRYTAPGSGDHTHDRGRAAFTSTTGSWPFLTGLEVLSSRTTRSLVAFGDSITDGFVGANPLSIPADRRVADTDQRYPDFLQRRINDAAIPVSVVNAGISSNRILTSGEPLMLGPSGIARFTRDALDQPGVAAVLVQEGINDLGLPPQSDAARIIAGYRQLITMAHDRGLEIWLGTLLPASDALVNGVLAPAAERQRQQINAWIRSQRVADRVVDFDRSLRDPEAPSRLRPSYSSPDRLHPNTTGYQAMANTVALSELKRLTATAGCTN